MKNKKTFYTCYTFNEFTKDFEYLQEFEDIKELKKEMAKKGINEKGIYNYIAKDIDSIKKLINGSILIIKDVEIIEE